MNELHRHLEEKDNLYARWHKRSTASNVVHWAIFVWVGTFMAGNLVNFIGSYFAGYAGVNSTLSTAAITLSSDGTISGINNPQLPLVYIDTTYPVLSSTHKIWYVDPTCVGKTNCNTSLQLAIDSSNQGDEIVVTAGMRIMGPIKLRYKAGTGTLVIRTSNLAGIPQAGTRVGPQHASAMPQIVAPGSNISAILTENMAHDYRLVGLEVTENANDDSNVLVQLGTGESLCATSTEPYKVCDTSVLSKYPYNIVLDRMYIHGTLTNNVKRGVGLDSKTAAVIDSYISEIHIVGEDAQAIAGLWGPGPYKIVNNYLAGSGENVMFGGDDPRVINLSPSDIEIRRNTFYKPLSWKSGDPTFNGRVWSVKNIFELKNAKRVLVDGNTFENNWVQSQSGIAILFTPRNQAGRCTWCVVSDVTFTNNTVKSSQGGAVNILGTDNENVSLRTERINVTNNLFQNIGGFFLQITRGPKDVVINHNTIQHTGNVITLDGEPTTNFAYENNISKHNSYGIIGSNLGTGNSAINYYLPGSIVTKNVLAGGSASSYPSGNYFPATFDQVGFVNWTGGNFALTTTSPYKNAGTDGKDLGVDTLQLNMASSAPTAPLPTEPVPPLTSTTTPSTSTTTPPTTPPTSTTTPPTIIGIQIGDRISVTADKLNVRPEPGKGNIGFQYFGSMGLVLEGPVSTKGYTWWRVNFDQGADGWVAGAYLQK